MQKDPVNAKRLIGFVPDEPFVYNKLTGREFINFIAGVFEIEKRYYDRCLPELLERFEIGAWIDEPSESYSHGMKQKIVMVQLLLHDPAVILIDEPLVGLDPKISKVVRETFIQLAKQGKALLVSTHTLSFAREIATRIGIIKSGKMKFVGTIEELAAISGTENIEEIYLRLSGNNSGD